ncbi:MAG: hypothetical protein P8J17_01890 [Halioglobus sp.]|nr:hypothetical protein [Halioglobus sp.]
MNASIEIIEEIDRRVKAGQIPPARAGLGLHWGPVVTGSVGSQTRKEYTVKGNMDNTTHGLSSQRCPDLLNYRVISL